MVRQVADVLFPSFMWISGVSNALSYKHLQRTIDAAETSHDVWMVGKARTDPPHRLTKLRA
jgi:hypothetical protein